MLAAQVEETVFQPDLFRVFLLAEHRHRQFGGGAQHLDLVDVDFDETCRQFGIFRAGRALPHLAVDAHHPFGAQLFRLLEGRTIRIGHHLREAVMVAQIDEQNAAVVADAVAPARQPHIFADVAVAERAAGMGAITMHEKRIRRAGLGKRAKNAWGACFVKASRFFRGSTARQRLVGSRNGQSRSPQT